MDSSIAFYAVAAACVAAVKLRNETKQSNNSSFSHTTSSTEQEEARLNPKLGYPIRRLFPTNFSYVHLNHGSYGVAPKEVMAAAREVMEGIESFPDDFMRRNALRRFTETSQLVADFVHAQKGSVVFVENATAAVNAVLNSLALKPGEAILINNHTYNACKNAANRAAERIGAHVLTQQVQVPLFTPRSAPSWSHALQDHTLQEAEIVKALDTIVNEFDAYLAAHPSIRFALIDHITSPTAIVMPVARMVAAAHERNVKIMIDGAHAPAQISGLNMTEIGADWYTGNLHKWSYTLKGVAYLYTHPDCQAETQSLIVSHFWKRGYADRFFMQGTNDQCRYLSYPDAVAFVHKHLGGFKAMQEYNIALAKIGGDILCNAWETERLLPIGLAAPFLVPIELPFNWKSWVRLADGTTDANGFKTEEEAEAALSRDEGFNERIANAVFFGYGIQCTVFPWKVNGKMHVYTRISAQVYNTPDDYRKYAAAVLDLKKKTNC